MNEEPTSADTPQQSPPPPLPQVAQYAPFPAEKTAGSLKWLVLIAVLATLIGLVPASLVGFLLHKGAASGSTGLLAGMITGAVITCILAALVLGLVAGGIGAIFKGRFGKVFLITYSVIVVVFPCFSALGNFKKAAESARMARSAGTRESVQGMQEDMERMIRESAELPAGEKRELSFEGMAKPTDTMGHLRALLREFFNEANAFQNEYVGALDEAGWNKLLDPARAAGDKDFKESRAILKSGREIVEQYRKKSSELMGKFPEKVDSLPVNAATKAEIKRGFTKGFTKTTDNMRQTWDLEVEIVNHVASLVDHLEERREHWDAANGQFTFDNDEDIERFNSIMGDINTCAGQQEQIRKEAAESASRKLSDLKEMVPAK